MKTATLYRPTGIKELELIAESGFTKFPPRLEWQPFFYPVLNEPYALQIAQEWNTRDAFSGFCGVVTSFRIDADYFNTLQVQNVGGDIHNELWIPSMTLDEFNAHIEGKIEVINAVFGKEFVNSAHPEVARILSSFRKE